MNIVDEYRVQRRLYRKRPATWRAICYFALNVLTNNMAGRRYYPRWFLVAREWFAR